jgi:hypothetical protein
MGALLPEFIFVLSMGYCEFIRPFTGLYYYCIALTSQGKGTAAILTKPLE